MAQQILDAFPDNSVLICQDSYYKDLSNLPYEERGKTNFDHPDSIDFTLLREQLIALKNNQSIEQPVYSFHVHNREAQTKHIEPAQFIIVEGILLFASDEVKDLFDIKIYIDTHPDIRILRRIERDINERSRTFVDIKRQYLTTVKPMHDLFVEPSKRFADIIVLGDKHNETALSLILAKMHQEMRQGIEISRR